MEFYLDVLLVCFMRVSVYRQSTNAEFERCLRLIQARALHPDLEEISCFCLIQTAMRIAQIYVQFIPFLQNDYD